MKKTSTNKKTSTSNKNVKYKFDSKSNVIFEDRHQHGNNYSVFKIIIDKNAPFYQYKYTEMGK